jgi:hypothetical protein
MTKLPNLTTASQENYMQWPLDLPVKDQALLPQTAKVELG